MTAQGTRAAVVDGLWTIALVISHSYATAALRASKGDLEFIVNWVNVVQISSRQRIAQSNWGSQQVQVPSQRQHPWSLQEE